MKKAYYLLIGLLTTLLFASCSSNDDYNSGVPQQDYSYLLQQFDLWEVDHSLTSGYGAVPFLDKAITITFSQGVLYANNNFSGLGFVGNGFGIDVASYQLGINSVAINHDLDGRFVLEIYYLGANKIQLIDRNQNITYTLYGFSKAAYDYEAVVYSNINLLLQEFVAWRKVEPLGSIGHAFDQENYLGFDISGNVFLSSVDLPNTPLSDIFWDYDGIYSVINTSDFKTKILELKYANGVETFELRLLDNGLDNTIYLYNLNTRVEYVFVGDGYIQFKRSQNKRVPVTEVVRNVTSNR